jgi:hypothetical protein
MTDPFPLRAVLEFIDLPSLGRSTVRVHVTPACGFDPATMASATVRGSDTALVRSLLLGVLSTCVEGGTVAFCKADRLARRVQRTFRAVVAAHPLSQQFPLGVCAIDPPLEG